MSAMYQVIGHSKLHFYAFLAVSVFLGSAGRTQAGFVVAEASFTSLTVTISGPGVQFLRPGSFDPFPNMPSFVTGSSHQAVARTTVASDSAGQPGMNLEDPVDGTFPTGGTDPRVAVAAVGTRAVALSGPHSFSVGVTPGTEILTSATMVFGAYLARIEGDDNPTTSDGIFAQASGSATINLSVVSTPSASSIIQVGYVISGGRIIESPGTAAFLEFDIFEPLLPSRTVFIGEPGAVPANAIPASAGISLAGLQVGDIISLTVIPRAVAVVPEPSSLVTFGLGALTLFGYGWRSRRRSSGGNNRT